MIFKISVRVLGLCLLLIAMSANIQLTTGIDDPHCFAKSESTSAVHFTCKMLHFPSHIFSIAHQMQGNEFKKIKNLSFTNSRLRFWPLDMFSGTVIKQLFLENCEILPFGNEVVGLSGTFEELFAEETVLIENGKWKLDVRQLKGVVLLQITFNKIPALTESISSMLPERLEELSFIGCVIEEIEGGFFSSLKYLEHLTLDDNNILTIPNTIVTLPRLKNLYLLNNEIVQLPGSMMDFFPNLNGLYLTFNNLRFLPENTWKDIFEKVDAVMLSNNPLMCDDQMKWIAFVNKPHKLEGQCKEPKELEKTKLRDLTPQHFEKVKN